MTFTFRYLPMLLNKFQFHFRLESFLIFCYKNTYFDMQDNSRSNTKMQIKTFWPSFNVQYVETALEVESISQESHQQVPLNCALQ